LRESWLFCHIKKKGDFFQLIFGLSFFYTNPSQILESPQIFALIFFLHNCSQIRTFTHLWNIHTGVEEGSPATLPPVAASLAKGALMASSAVAPLAVKQFVAAFKL